MIMLGNKILRKDIDIGFKSDTFQLLPVISIEISNKYLEITIGFFFLHSLFISVILYIK